MRERTILHATGERLQTIGRYQIVRRIGRGGMGDVWLCEDPRLKRQVAIKTLPPFAQQDSELARRFEREARAVAALTHPHILPLHDYGRQTLSDGSTMIYLVTPYIPGGSLAARLSSYQQQNCSMPTQEAFLFLKQAAQAIDHAHRKQVIHRDIKPGNMLLRDDDWLLLADFGIARLVSNAERLTKTGQSIGTPEYMAPEQIQGKASITSDNYSLAVIAYQIFTGRVPFRADTALATLMQHLTAPPPLPQQFNPELTPPFTQILLRGLNKDPEQRPALATEFITQLERAYADPLYQSTALRTIRDLPALTFFEGISTIYLKNSQQPTRSSLSRRQFFFGAGAATAALAGTTLGAWAILNNAQSASPALPPQPTISARPTHTGANLPALVLTGHSRPAYNMQWTSDSQTLITSSIDGQVLRWNIPQLVHQPTRPAGTPFYTGTPLQFSNLSSPSFPISPIFLALSLDGTLLAIGNTVQSQAKACITIYTMSDLRVKTQIDVVKDPLDRGTISIMDWLPGNYLMFAQYIQLSGAKGDQATVYVVDPQQPQRLWNIAEVTRADYTVGETIQSILAPYSATSMTRALVYDNSIVIGDVSLTGKASWQARTHITYNTNDTFKPADWSADGKSIAGLVETKRNDRTVYLPAYIDNWQAKKPQIVILPALNTKDTYNDPLLVCDPISNTRRAALGTTLGEIFLYDLKANTALVRELTSDGIQGYMRSLSWSPDGCWLAAGVQDRYSSIAVWKL